MNTAFNTYMVGVGKADTKVVSFGELMLVYRCQCACKFKIPLFSSTRINLDLKMSY